MRDLRTWRLTIGGVAALAAALAISTAGAATATHQVVYNFTGQKDGGNAATGLVFDSAGNAYGTTVQGGAFGCGTIFRLTPAVGQWTPKTLWAFTCGSDGKNPHGGLTFDKAGNLYGTTVAGGDGGFCTGDGCGVVFRLGVRGSLRPIYAFTGKLDGFGPGSPVVFDAAGNIYGTAPDGGEHKMGVVYRLSFHRDHWVQTVIHAFTGKSDGAVGSLGPLLVDAAGDLFGVTELGGKFGAGVAFKMTPGTGGTFTFTTIHTFKGTPDAGSPYGGLIPDSAGNLYGTTYFGGTNGAGSVYELTPQSTGRYSERVLYSFQGGSDGDLPTSTLIFDAAGDLFGTTSSGGNTCDCGTIFKIAAGTAKETILYRFGSSSTDGHNPYYGLSFDMAGNLDTSTVAGGTFGEGTIFSTTP